MTAPTGWLPAPVDELFGPDATAEESYEVLTVDIPPASWLAALETARTTLNCTFFDWLSAVDEPGTGFRVSAHVVALAPVRRLLLRTTVPHSAPELPSAVGVYAGARWHERETHEMFGVRFSGHPGLDHLLLPETFEGHPLRKDFVLAARVAKAWPGAKEPGESDHGGPRRRQMLPPGVPDPNEWGPLKGRLPAAPARPARAAAGRPTGERPAGPPGERPTRTPGERPVRRSRTAAEGSASQTGGAGDPAGPTPAAEATPAVEAASAEAQPTSTPRRGRSVTEGSASQRAVSGEQPSAGPRRGRSVSEGSASQRAASAADETAPTEEPTAAAPRGPRRARTASGGSASQRAPQTAPSAEPATPARPATPRSADAPWHHARPAFDEPGGEERRVTSTESTEPTEARGAGPETEKPEAGEPTGSESTRSEHAGRGSAAPESAGPEPAGPKSAGPKSAPPEPAASAPTTPARAEPEPAAPEAPEDAEASQDAGPETSPPDSADASAPDAPSPEAPVPPPDSAAPEQPAPREDRPGGP
ncbi:NADH-quinone oxidoreductase subunit C [Streptomyces sp. NPDC056660]|uniref:NADH-quinone oxidoreductase subunit C n=1 Tax=Streptomyces sp. NPDC056660 TaxID=3345897 RepID=UPI0036B4DE5C